ncbi:MAG: hypothetical protein IPM54_43520 [Polyangiaceae bacterium]|nr:hypothetical protein [Polyangiaceae bacterium]
MHRPSRQHNHLLQKIARKESLAKARKRHVGRRLKQWRKWSKAYEGLVQQAS